MTFPFLGLRHIFVVIISTALIYILKLVIEIWIICIIQILILTVINWFLVNLTVHIVNHKLRVGQLIRETIEIELSLWMISLVIATIVWVVRGVRCHLELWGAGEASMLSALTFSRSWSRCREMLLPFLRLRCIFLSFSWIVDTAAMDPWLSTFHHWIMLIEMDSTITAQDLVISAGCCVCWFHIVDPFEPPIERHGVLCWSIVLLHKRARGRHRIFSPSCLAEVSLVWLELDSWMLSELWLIVMYHSLHELLRARYQLSRRHAGILMLILNILLLNWWLRTH